MSSPEVAERRTPVPRGIARSGPALLSYGFRPFFLLAGIMAVVAMAGWIGALALGWEVGGSYGALNWHAHEMLFGYASAALAGFMLTAIPNWTGRLPVSGLPLLGLVTLWLAGRAAMAAPDVAGLVPSVLLDATFLPVLAVVAAREIVAGKNWKNLKILTGLVGLSVANGWFHVSVLTGGEALTASRATVGLYAVLISLVGGRIVPSFTRNWLAKAGSTILPRPFSRFDAGSIVVLAVAAIIWTLAEHGIATAAIAAFASSVHVMRLARWAGWRTLEEPLLVVLHVGYGFVPLGMACVALAALDVIATASALHVLTVGAIGVMTLAVMTRASLGHTGRKLLASPWAALAYLALTVAAVTRPFAEIVPAHYHLLLELAAVCWIGAFALFLAEYAPILLRRSPAELARRAARS
jgi:uncharacterized protein involved in response to NO